VSRHQAGKVHELLLEDRDRTVTDDGGAKSAVEIGVEAAEPVHEPQLEVTLERPAPHVDRCTKAAYHPHAVIRREFAENRRHFGLVQTAVVPEYVGRDIDPGVQELRG
jgi:hypothetical protein